MAIVQDILYNRGLVNINHQDYGIFCSESYKSCGLFLGILENYNYNYNIPAAERPSPVNRDYDPCN